MTISAMTSELMIVSLTKLVWYGGVLASKDKVIHYLYIITIMCT